MQPTQEVLNYRQNTVAALISAKGQAVPWNGPGPKPPTYMDAADVQTEIDKLLAFWKAQDDGVQPPPFVPGPIATIDLLLPGSRFVQGGWEFEVFETPFGNMQRKVGPAPTAAPAPTVTAASTLAAVVAYARGRFADTADPKEQGELNRLLTFLAGLPKG